MKRVITFIIAMAVISLVFVSPAFAYGSDDGKLIVTHINVVPDYYEGTAVIYTESEDGTLGAYGTFTWWYCVSFEYDGAEGTYKVKETNAAVETSKAAMKIPENGFCYCVNLGNNYPQLYKDNPELYAQYADPGVFPNYTTEAVTSSFNYTKTLKVGDTVYLYNADLANAIIRTNDYLWYQSAYVTDTFISVGKPFGSEQYYVPDGSYVISKEYKLGINSVNVGYGEGRAILFTPSWGEGLQSGFDWWRVAVFDWSDENDAYILVSANNMVGSGHEKMPQMPENGFIIAANLGNDYSASGGIDYVNVIGSGTYEKLAQIPVGSKCYVTGIDLKTANAELGSGNYYDDNFQTNVYVSFTEEPVEGCYRPDTAQERLQTPTLSYTGNENRVGAGGFDISWDAVENADSYEVWVYNSTTNPNGKAVISNQIVTEPKFTVTDGTLETGNTYNITVVAHGEGYRCSLMTQAGFAVMSERAAQGMFNDKKIIAFGDSITAAAGGYVDMLYGELGVEVINAGVGGNTTEQALARIQSDVIDKKPNIVLVNFGMNDQAYNKSLNINLIPLQAYRENYASIIEQLKAAGAVVVLVTPQAVCTENGFYVSGADSLDYGTGAIADYCNVVRELAVEYNLGLVDIYSAVEQSGELTKIVTFDGIHPSAYGHKLYATLIADYLYESNGLDKAESGVDSSLEAEASQNQSETQPQGSDTLTTILILVLLIVIVAVTIMFVLFMRKNKEKK